MAQYDVYILDRSEDLFLELQSGNIQHLPTRMGSPLVLKNNFHKPIEQLHPEVVIGGNSYVMLSHHLFSVPVSSLRQNVGNLSTASYKISLALDMLFYGF